MSTCRLLIQADKERYHWRLVSGFNTVVFHRTHSWFSESCEKWGHVTYTCMLSVCFHAICKDHWSCWQTVKFCLGMLVWREVWSVWELFLFCFFFLKKKVCGKKTCQECLQIPEISSRCFISVLKKHFLFKTWFISQCFCPSVSHCISRWLLAFSLSWFAMDWNNQRVFSASRHLSFCFGLVFFNWFFFFLSEFSANLYSVLEKLFSAVKPSTYSETLLNDFSHQCLVPWNTQDKISHSRNYPMNPVIIIVDFITVHH